MDARAVRVELAPVRVVFREVLLFRNQVDDIETEPFDAFLAPEAHHLIDVLAHLRIFPIQIGLRDVEQVKIILAALLVILPGVAPELRLPVRRLVAPDVVVAVALVPGERLLEPLVLGRRVVDDDVHHEPDATRLGFADELVEVVHRPVRWVDRVIVAHVITVIVLWGLVHRRHPDVLDAELGQVVELRGHPFDGSGGVTFRAVEAFRIDLIDDGFAPVFLCHVCNLLFCKSFHSNRKEGRTAVPPSRVIMLLYFVRFHLSSCNASTRRTLRRMGRRSR